MHKITGKQYALFPITEDNHCFLIVYELSEFKMTIYDAMNHNCGKVLATFIEECLPSPKKTIFKLLQLLTFHIHQTCQNVVLSCA